MGAFQGETMPIYQISTQSVQRLGSYRERLHTDIQTDRHTDRHFSGNGLNRLGGHQNGYIRRYLNFFFPHDHNTFPTSGTRESNNVNNDYCMK